MPSIIDPQPINGDVYHDVYLCETDKTIIGAIKVENLETKEKWNDYSEVTFTAYNKYIDMITGETRDHPFYDKIEQLRKVYVTDLGYFIIQEAPVKKDAFVETKECLLFSEEYELTQKYLEDFEINSGEVASIDGVRFYDQANPSKSLLHLVLEKAPSWSIGYVEQSLWSIERTYNVDREDIYDFLMNDVADTTKCIFVFDTVENEINVYTEETAGQDTGVYVSLRNLAKEINIKYNADDIKTVLSVTGDSDLDIREVNLGLPYIMDLSYYATEEWMGASLYSAYTDYMAVVSYYSPIYSQKIIDLDALYVEADNLENKIDTNVVIGTTDPTIYTLSSCGLRQLEEWLAYYKQQQMVQVEGGFAAQPEGSTEYDRYAETLDCIEALESGISDAEATIDNKEQEISTLQGQLNDISRSVAMENNFTEDQLKALSYFMREDEYNDTNFVVIDTDTDSDILELKQELMETAQIELSRISKPQLEFDADIENIYAIPEFEPLLSGFEPGNFITVEVRDNYILKVRILEIDRSENDLSSMILSFGNLLRLKDQGDVHADLLAQATTAGKSVANNSSHWQRGAKKANTTEQRIDKGLIDVATSLKSSDGGQSVEWDIYGIHLRKTDDLGNIDPREGWITNNQIVYSSDNFKTARSVFGEYSIGGESRWGVLAEAVIAGYIEGSTIVGSVIQSSNYSDESDNGSRIDLNEGDFSLAGGRIQFRKEGNQWKLDIKVDSFTVGNDTVDTKISNAISPIETDIANLQTSTNALYNKTEALNLLSYSVSNGLTLSDRPTNPNNLVNIASTGVTISGGGATATLESSKFNSSQMQANTMYIGGKWAIIYRSASDHMTIKYVGGDS